MVTMSSAASQEIG